MVYNFSCASCGASYVGSTIRNLHIRIQQHLGKSVRTGKFLTNPDSSPIREHSLACDTLVTSDSFSIIGKTSSSLDLRILESLHIFQRKPSLNSMASSFPLHTVRWAMYSCLPIDVDRPIVITCPIRTYVFFSKVLILSCECYSVSSLRLKMKSLTLKRRANIPIPFL